MDPRSAPPAYEEVIPHQNKYNNSILTPAYRVYPVNTVQPHSTVTPILHLNTPYPIQTFQSGPTSLQLSTKTQYTKFKLIKLQKTSKQMQ